MALNQNNPPKKNSNSRPNHNHPGLLNCWATTIHAVTVWPFLSRQKSGPVFIKLGQWLSTRRDIIRSISVSKKSREGTVRARSEMEVKTAKKNRYPVANKINKSPLTEKSVGKIRKMLVRKDKGF